MDTFAKTQVIWAETKDLRVPGGGSSAPLARLRQELAAIIGDTPDSFTRFEAVPAQDDPIYGSAVQDCAAAAAAIQPNPPDRYRIIVWPSADSKTLDSRDLAPPAPWDTADPAGFELIGTFDVLDTTAKVAAFRQLAAAGEPRFASLVTGTGLSADTEVYAPRATAGRQVSRRAARWGFWLSMAALVIFAGACMWSLGVGKVARLAEANFSVSRSEACTPKVDPNNARTLFSVDKTWLPSATGSGSCLALWETAVGAAFDEQARSDDWWVRTEAAWAGTTVSNSRSFSLAMPTTLTMVAIALLAVAAGLGVVGRPMGIVIDKRNRMSLTRAQFAVWLVIIMGGLTSLAMFNAGFWGGSLNQVRASIATAQDPAEVDATLKTLADKANQLLEFVPVLDGALWGLIGITAGTTILSTLVMDPGNRNGSSDPNTPTRPAPGRRVQVLTKKDPQDAKLGDLVFGETDESRDVVDTNRVQTVATTGLLAAIYLGLIFEAVRGIGGLTTSVAVDQGVQVFGSMPPVGTTFLLLLAASHGVLAVGKLMGANK